MIVMAVANLFGRKEGLEVEASTLALITSPGLIGQITHIFRSTLEVAENFKK